MYATLSLNTAGVKPSGDHWRSLYAKFVSLSRDCNFGEDFFIAMLEKNSNFDQLQCRYITKERCVT